MDTTTVHFFSIFMAFFAIMNPIANSSLFIGLTQEFDAQTRRMIALRAVIVLRLSRAPSGRAGLQYDT